MSSTTSESKEVKQAKPPWTFLTNYSHVLIFLAVEPEATVRTVAESVGITERAVHTIIANLVAENVLVREKIGRRIRYRINGDAPLRHPIERHRTVGDLVVLGFPRSNPWPDPAIQSLAQA